MRCAHCGCENDDGPGGKPRSPEQLRRFFAVIIREAYRNWPESHAVQFATETECRKWLTVKAGYYDVTMRLPLQGVRASTAVMIAEASMRAAGAYAIAREHKGELVIAKPKSIAFNKMGHEQFCKLNDAIAAVVAMETGIDVDGVVMEKEPA